MDMERLVRLMAVKIYAVWPHHQYGWHAFQYLTVVRRIPDALLSIRCRARLWVPGLGSFPPHWAIREVLLLSEPVRDQSPAKVRDG